MAREEVHLAFIEDLLSDVDFDDDERDLPVSTVDKVTRLLEMYRAAQESTREVGKLLGDMERSRDQWKNTAEKRLRAINAALTALRD